MRVCPGHNTTSALSFEAGLPITEAPRKESPAAAATAVAAAWSGVAPAGSGTLVPTTAAAVLRLSVLAATWSTSCEARVEVLNV